LARVLFLFSSPLYTPFATNPAKLMRGEPRDENVCLQARTPRTPQV